MMSPFLIVNYLNFTAVPYILELICDANSCKEGRIYLKEYDLTYEKGGAIYNSKEKMYFYEVLG
jgi:hypothetical protein